jgi:signal transduction histidine kinase
VWAIVLLGWAAYSIASFLVPFVRWLAGTPAAGRLPSLPLPALLMALTFAAIAILVLGRRVGTPLGDVVAAAERVAEGDRGVRVRENGPPWLQSVARAFNSMTVRLERQQQQRRELMADVAHELRTPLTAMQGRLEGMLDGVYPTDEAHVAQVLDDTRMLARLVEDLRTLSDSEAGTLALQKEPTDIGALLHDTASSFQAIADARHVRLAVHVAGHLPAVEIDAVRTREVLTNLVSNALRHSPAGTTVVIDAVSADGAVRVSVADDGPGVPAVDIPRMFDRFYKGSSSNGSGIGLTIVRNLVAAHGGEITAANRDDGGFAVSFTLPLRQ